MKDWLWNRVNTSSFGVQASACNMLVDWKSAAEAKRRQVVQNQQSTRVWCKPPHGWVKINVDAACNLRSGQMGVACVIRDDRGKFIRARSNVVRGGWMPREVEAIGLREALSWTKTWRQHKCIFECDAKCLVDAVNGSAGQSFFDTIVDDCREILKHFDEVLVVFVYRSANTVAHMLAQATYSMSGLQEWLSVAPDFIVCNLASEEV